MLFEPYISIIFSSVYRLWELHGHSIASSSPVHELIHEVASPLTVATFSLEEIDRLVKSSPSPLHPKVEVALEALSQARSVLHASSGEQEISGHFNAEQTLFGIVQLLQYRARRKGVFVFYQSEVPHLWDSEARIQLNGNPVRFQQLVMNLVNNAVDAYEARGMSSNRTVLVTLKKRRLSAELKVQDWGGGIEKKMAGRVFHLFFSTKGGKVRGRGLNLAKRIVEKEFHGQISFKSKVGKGTTFKVVLPTDSSRESKKYTTKF